MNCPETLYRIAFAIIVVACCAASVAAQAGTVVPILECVMTDTETDISTVYIGYNNTTGAR